MKTKFIIEQFLKFHARILLENVYQRNICPEFYLFEENLKKLGKVTDSEEFINQIADKIDLAFDMLTVTDRVENLQLRWINLKNKYFE